MENKTYTAKKGSALVTKAGVKAHGEQITKKMIGDNFDELIKKGHLVELVAPTTEKAPTEDINLKTEAAQKTDDAPKTLTDMTKAELLAVAEPFSLELDKKATKAQIIEAIEAAQKAADGKDAGAEGGAPGEGAQRTGDAT